MAYQHTDLVKVEYRVRKIERFVVTRYYEDHGGKGAGSQMKGEYDSADMAYEVGYALAKQEHDQLGWAPGDERILYPRHPMHDSAQTVDNGNRLTDIGG